jgi:hypothetical protein
MCCMVSCVLDGVPLVGWCARCSAVTHVCLPPCLVVLTPKVKQLYGCTKEDPKPKDQEDSWPLLWSAFKESIYGVFVCEKGDTPNPSGLSPLFSEVPSACSFFRVCV